jgi:hypothetical protein
LLNMDYSHAFVGKALPLPHIWEQWHSASFDRWPGATACIPAIHDDDIPRGLRESIDDGAPLTGGLPTNIASQYK